MTSQELKSAILGALRVQKFTPSYETRCRVGGVRRGVWLVKTLKASAW